MFSSRINHGSRVDFILWCIHQYDVLFMSDWRNASKDALFHDTDIDAIKTICGKDNTDDYIKKALWVGFMQGREFGSKEQREEYRKKNLKKK